jgi:gamma-glutamyltranspeptidase / glutathione hydrolase
MSGIGSLTPDGTRPSARSVRGMVTAPNALATQAGVAILRAGGTAADAGVAVAAALSVVYPHMTGIGGDAFFLYHDAATRQVHAYNGSGRSAALATRGFYESAGLAAIPAQGGLAALTVPGAVDAWFALHERFGALPLEHVLVPAIDLARLGAPLARSMARALHEERAALESDAGARALYAARREYAIGERFAQPALAKTLERIAREGREFWYEGEAAAHIEATCKRAGSPLRATDCAAHRGFYTEPARAVFGRYASLTTPPNSQGIVLPIAQGIYDAIDGHERLLDGSAELAHTCIEAIRLAFADRDRWVGDPDVIKTPLHELLSPEHARECAGRIDAQRAS